MSQFFPAPCRLRLAVLALVVFLAACAGGVRESRDALAGEVVLVAGGSGRAGVYVLRQLKAQQIAFRATTRSIAEARQRLGADAAGVEWIEADLRDADAARRSLAGVDRVICVIGSRELAGDNSAEFVDYGAVRNLVDAARAERVKQVVLLSAIGTTDKDSIANKLFKGALEWRYKGEQYLRASGVPYTVVRPAGLVNEPAGAKGVKLWQGDDWKSHVRKTISRDDLALVLIESLREPGARNTSFEITNEVAESPGSWRGQLARLVRD